MRRNARCTTSRCTTSLFNISQTFLIRYRLFVFAFNVRHDTMQTSNRSTQVSVACLSVVHDLLIRRLSMWRHSEWGPCVLGLCTSEALVVSCLTVGCRPRVQHGDVSQQFTAVLSFPSLWKSCSESGSILLFLYHIRRCVTKAYLLSDLLTDSPLYVVVIFSFPSLSMVLLEAEQWCWVSTLNACTQSGCQSIQINRLYFKKMQIPVEAKLRPTERVGGIRELRIS